MLPVFAHGKAASLNIRLDRPGNPSRKLIPRNSKVFPKDFFSTKSDSKLNSNTCLIGLNSPRLDLLDSADKENRPPNKSHFSSEKNLHQSLNLKDYTLWSQQRGHSNVEAGTLLGSPSEGFMLVDLANASSDRRILADYQEVYKMRENRDDEYFKKTGHVKRKRLDQCNMFFSISEADETICNMQSPGEKRRAVTEEEPQRTPMFKYQESLPSVQKEMKARKLVFDSEKVDFQSHRSVSQSSIHEPGLSSKLNYTRNPRETAILRNYRPVRKSEFFVGEDVRISSSEVEIQLPKRGFLPSIIKN